uniref:Interferon regulatory factor 5 n=1 Tax=Catharus ustulatus TaxID=91951 RepID=A0A8C3UWB1_CATUS
SAAAPGRSRPVSPHPWLVAQVSSQRFPGLRWLDPERRRFVIPWGHATRNPPGPQDHDTIFKAWAQETGRFRAGDPPDPPRWKATLRCALNKSREFRLLLDGPRGSPAQPFRIYELCEEPPGAAGTGGSGEAPQSPPQPTGTQRPQRPRPPQGAHPPVPLNIPPAPPSSLCVSQPRSFPCRRGR